MRRCDESNLLTAKNPEKGVNPISREFFRERPDSSEIARFYLGLSAGVKRLSCIPLDEIKGSGNLPVMTTGNDDNPALQLLTDAALDQIIDRLLNHDGLEHLLDRVANRAVRKFDAAQSADEEWLTTEEVAEELSMTPNAVRNAKHRGVLVSGRKQGRCRLFSRSAINTYLENGE